MAYLFKAATLLLLLLQLVFCTAYAQQNDYQLHIHVHYQPEQDRWQVQYQLPIAVDHVAFSRRSNFDRSKLYNIDPEKFRFDTAGDVLLIRSVDGSKFTQLELSFTSYYDFIQKDYTHNVRYTDGSNLLYTNHLTLGASIIDDKSISPIGASFGDTQMHFYVAGQHIAFLGQRYFETASWQVDDRGTYIYFGNITPVENDNMLAIIDPKLPTWVWAQTQRYFPKLFDYYHDQTGQALNFKPMVFFNYDNLDGDYANNSGGTLEGLVQLTINGKRWHEENKSLFNSLFLFLAHEAAHFWNGQMFSNPQQQNAWLHEGGADAFAYLAMREFGLFDNSQMLQAFEDAANNCLLNKGPQALRQAAELWQHRNYYTCGATMAFASHSAIQAKSADKSLFDLWRALFAASGENRHYTEQDYFNQLSQLTGSDTLAQALARFSQQDAADNQAQITAWFTDTAIAITPTTDYPQTSQRHWGRQIVLNLMQMHCNAISLSSYDDHVVAYPLGACQPFDKE